MASVFKDGQKNKHKKYIHLAADCDICEFNELNVQHIWKRKMHC